MNPATAADKVFSSLIGSKPANRFLSSAQSLRIKLDRRKKKLQPLKVYCSKGLTYKEAGVDIDAGSELVRRIAKMAPGVGGFGGLFPLGDSYLVAGTDGVGTKLKLAFETGIHVTIGIDLVIKGIVDGCRQSDCALLGGETAEMPEFYAAGEYDLSGFAVGIVKKDAVINGKNIEAGDVLVGLPSSGVHSNGFSLVRRVLAQSGLSLKDQLPESDGKITLGEALMAPTVIYAKVLDIISRGGVKGIAHITGGGFTDNIPRVFPEGLGAKIFSSSWKIPAVFNWLQKVVKLIIWKLGWRVGLLIHIPGKAQSWNGASPGFSGLKACWVGPHWAHSQLVAGSFVAVEAKFACLL